MFALTDFDPYGIHIFSCYKFGSKTLQHDLTAQALDIQWLGINAEHLTSLTDDMSALLEGNDDPRLPISVNSGTIPLTSKDRRAALLFLKKLQTSGVCDLQRQTQTMLMLGAKAEIQALDENGCTSLWLEMLLLHALKS